MKIPQLTMGNKSIENNLNKKFETDIMSFYNNSYKEAQSFFDDFPEAENKFIVSSDYEVKKSYQCHAGWCMRILYGSMWF
mgnify:FL=1